MDILKERGLETNETNERGIREGLRKEFGMGAYAVKNIPKIEASLTLGQDVIIDGLYSWTELKILKDRFPEIKILAIQTSPSIRYERLAKREIRPLTNQEAASRDLAEIENVEKAGPIAMADEIIVNDLGKEELISNLETVYSLFTGKETKQTITQEKKTEEKKVDPTNKRPSKVDYYLEIAKQVCQRSTCLRRKFGAVIVNQSDKIISTGYNGAVRKAKDCYEIGKCMREELKIPKGQRYELCKSVHAEQNAVFGTDPSERRGATLYLYGQMADGSPSYCEPCMMCKRTIVQAELSKVVARQEDGNIKEWDVKEFVIEENLGKNFPKEIQETKEFKGYMEKLNGN